MALLAPQSIARTGTVVTFTAATTGPGDTFVANTRGILVIKNASGASITATIVIPGNSEYGQANPDIPVTVAAAAEVQVGPFPANAADPVTGLITVTYSAVTSVTVAYMSLGA